MTEPTVKTLKGLIERQRPNLVRYGFTKRHYNILEDVFRNWMSGAPRVSAAIFVNEHWKDEKIIQFLVNANFFQAPDSKYYVPQFEAFAALLVDRRKVVTRLWHDMEDVLKRSESLIKHNPEQTSIPLPEFIEPLENYPGLVDAMALLSSSGIGFFFYSNQVYPTVQFTEQVRRNCKSFLGFVDSKIGQRVAYPNGVAAVFPGLNFAQTASGTPDVERLQRVPDAAAKASKAIDQLSIDPGAAISLAKSSLEATLKWIVHRDGRELPKKISMPDLFKQCKPLMPSLANPTFLMGRSVTSLVTEIAAARNLLGDSHGKSPNAVEPTRSEARFIVITALELAAFLIDQWEFDKHASGLSMNGILARKRLKNTS